MRAEPGGCHWCGVMQREHYNRWHETAGYHQWTAPTDAQILERMRARRAARPANTGQDLPDRLHANLRAYLELGGDLADVATVMAMREAEASAALDRAGHARTYAIEEPKETP